MSFIDDSVKNVKNSVLKEVSTAPGAGKGKGKGGKGKGKKGKDEK